MEGWRAGMIERHAEVEGREEGILAPYCPLLEGRSSMFGGFRLSMRVRKCAREALFFCLFH